MSADAVARHFIEEMIPHHDDAVVMAELALAQAEHPELRRLAADIVRVQTEEITLMRLWYRDWFGGEPASAEVASTDQGMAGAGQGMRAQMTPHMGEGMGPVTNHGMGQGMGLASDHEMGHGVRMAMQAEPGQATGMSMPMGMGHGMGGHDPTSIDGAVPFDKAFIEEMIPHHEMAVVMSTMALRHVDRPELQALLRSIIESQSAEIAQMRAWYEAWYGVPVPGTGSRGGMVPAVRGLAPDEVRAIRAGEGAGMARAAELNGLPGPRHVLDLAEGLGLSPEQRAQVQATHGAMQEEAVRLGQAYLGAQEAFEHSLRDPALRRPALDAQHPQLASLQGELQRVHLRAHLATAEVLTPSQVAIYNTLRGYPPVD